ncbi:T9SS type B sorting domain-containing protein [Aquimarina aggregata]|uniref:T9SS type B sorting domain-containing protein n=1 Tax=Aquimarina aggregata TaxID=1642818 RepID=UPI00249068F6|nr:T9SS type B sorting domain-containing protein [Aquimarina aggregata]
MKKENYKRLKLVVLLFLTTVGVFAQQDFRPRQNISTRGDILVTGNTILGLINNPTSPTLGPNGPYNGNASNGGAGLETAYIDIDGDNTTFSSSSADLINPSAENCATIRYAGLYWTANYYMAREGFPTTYTEDQISTADAESNSNTVLTINNTREANIYALRVTEFSNDNSSIRLSPASSNLVVAAPRNGCGITNAGALAGNIAVIETGGGCTDREKVINAQNAGAIGVIIVNDNGFLQRATGNGPTITIPSATIGDNDIFGDNLIDVINSEPNVMNATMSTTGNEIFTGLPTNDGRINGTADYKDILFGFGAPGAIAYTPIQPQIGTAFVDVNGVATETHSGVIYDGYAGTLSNPGTSATDNVPYTCYADVTAIVQANGYGTYTVANMKATLGETSGVSGAAGGWTLVVIYNDPSPAEDNRFMTVFDGFREIQGTNTTGVDIPISGFQTLPPNLPVNVKFGLASLEGDLGISGDRLGIIDPARLATPGPYDNTDFTDLFNGANGVTNFFNSSISVEDNITTTRLPASTNTLGFDTDFWTLGNAAKDLLGNSQTETVFRLRTTQDTYQAFMTLFSVEEIVPELRLLKEVYDPGDLGTVINGQSVELGDFLTYRLRLENTGNEDYKDNVVVTDRLPANVDLQNIDGIIIDPANPATLTGNLVSIPSITYEVTIGGGGEQTIVFQVPPDLLTHTGIAGPGTGELQIDFTVQLVSDCASLRDACSNEINNLAIGRFTGILSDEPTPRETPSSSTVIEPCGVIDGLATNFLANVPACEQNASTCGDELILTAGAGYDRYTWSGPNGFSAVTAIPSVIVPNVIPPATLAGTYTVIKEDTNPADGTCMTLTEEIEVTDFSVIAHPLQNDAVTEDFIDYFDSTNGGCGQPLAKITLCGDETYTVDSERNPDNLVSITWQELTNDACRDRDDNCPAITGGCEANANWTSLPSADAKPITYEFSDAGEYRLVLEIVGGCTRIFYFDINKNDYQPEVDTIDMECSNDGLVQVNNIPPGDTYRFVIRLATDPEPTIAQVLASTNTDGRFIIPFQVNPYVFTVYAVDSSFPNCVYEIDGTLRSFDPNFDITITGPECTNNDNLNGLGSIRVEITGGIPLYEYSIQGGPDNINIVTGNSEATNGDFTFGDLRPGTYTIQAVSNRNPDPECIREFTNVIVPEAPDFTARVDLIAPATCDSGAIVEVVVTAGTGGPYEFADSSGVFNSPLAGDPQDRFRFTLPTTAVPTDVFTFRVNDTSTALNCIISADITGIDAYVPIEFQSVVATSPVCPTDPGSVAVTLTPASDIAGRSFTYEVVTIDSSTTPPTVLTTVQTATSPDPTVNIANVPVGTDYVIRVTHNNTTDPAGAPICAVFSTPPFDITAATAVDFDINRTRDLSCITGSEDAQVTISNFSGGAGTYEYSITSPTTGFVAITGTSVVIDVDTAQTGFTVYVRDPLAPDCSVPQSVDIPALLEVTDLTFSVPGASNCTTQTFNVTVQAEPVGPVYTYAVTPAPVSGNSNTGVFRLRRGTVYTFTATNTTNQCFRNEVFTEDTIPQIRIIDATAGSESCEDADDGRISFTIENSTNFEYEIRGPSPSNALVTNGSSTTPTVTVQSPAVSLTPGTYTIEVTDTSLTPASANCSDDITVTVNPVVPITFTINDVNQDCGTNLNEVSISNPMGGNGPTYTYTLTHPVNGTFGPANSTDAIPNVPNGAGTDYTVTVFDTTGVCNATQTLTIDPLTPLQAVIANTSDVCLDDNSISFIVTINPNSNGSTGTPDYRYTVSRNGTIVQTSTVVTGAVASFTTNTFTQDGDYEIILTDDNDCSVTLTETVEPAVNIAARRVNDLRCDPVTGLLLQAEIELTISDGYTDYTVTWENTTNTTSGTVAGSPGAGPVFTHLTSDVGDYIFTVTDARGCTDTSTAEVTSNNNPPTVTAPDIDVDCNGDTGIIRITATGADSGGYQISFDGAAFVPMPPSGTIEFVRGAGNYPFEFRDSRSCPYTGFDVDVNEPAALNAASSKTDITCDDSVGGVGEILGSIRITLTGGTVTPAGDASGYTYQVTRNGVVDATILPAFAPTVPPNPPALGVDEVLFDGLDFGVYEILITDDNDCTTTVTETINSGPRVSFTLGAVGATCPAGYTQNVNITGGSTTAPGFELDLRILGSATSIVTTNLGVDGFGNPITTYSESGLDFGVTYVVTVRDLNTGCRFRAEFNENGPSSPVISNVVPGDISCNQTPALTDGTFTFDITGYDPVPGQDLTWEVLDRFDLTNVIQTGTTVVLTTDPETIGPLGALPEGRYFLRVTERLGAQCPSNLVEFEIETPDPLVTTGNNPSAPECQTSASLVVNTTGGTETGGSITPGDGYVYQVVERGDPAVPANYVSLPIPVTAAPNTITFNTDTNGDGATDATDQLLWDILTRDDNGCEHRLEITVSVIPGPTLTTPTIVDNPCDTDDFVFTVTAVGTGSLSYGIDDGVNPVAFVPDGASHEFMVDAPGTYTVIVRDGNGCTDTDTITILPPLTIEAVFTAPNCEAADGTITTSITSGTLAGATPPRYELFTVTGGVVVTPAIQTNATGVFPGIAVGEYEIVLTDIDRNPATGCPYRTRVGLEGPTLPVIDPTMGITNMTCNSDTPPTGSITVTLTAPFEAGVTYEYEITAAPATVDLRARQVSPTFNNLDVDVYEVTVYATVVNGSGAGAVTVECVNTANIPITEPAPIVANPSVTPYGCDSSNNEVFPVITLDISGGDGTYRVSYTRPAPLSPVVDEVAVDSDPVTPGVQHQVTAPVGNGTYTFTIEDSNNCSGTTNIPVPVFEIMTMAEANQDTAATCTSNEIVTVTVTGGSGNYIFTRVDGTGAVLDTQDPAAGVFEADFTLNNVVGDTFNFVVRDEGTMCTIPTTYTIPEYDNFELTAAEETPETCFEDRDGRARFTVLGGYIGVVSYTITSEDAVGTVTIIYDSVASGTNETTTATTNSFVVPRAGEPGLGIGNYTINVVQIGAPECDEAASFTITGPTADFEVDISPRNDQESCNPGGDISFQASVTGARGDVTYTLVETGLTNTTGLFEGLSIAQATPVVPPTVPPTFTFTVTATDTDPGGTFVCTDDDIITVRPPADDVNISLVEDFDVSCFGEADGRIVVTATGTDTPLRYSLTPAGGTEGVLQTSNEFRNLAPGNYTVTAYDELGCTDTSPAIINELAELTVNFNASLIDCTGNPNPTVDVTVTGGFDGATGIINGRTITTFVVLDIGTDRLNPVEVQRNTTGIFTLPVGEYQFFVIDNTGCESRPSGALPVIAIPDIEITLDDRFAFVNCNGGSNGVIDASVIGGTGMYTFTLSTVSGNLADGTPFTPIVQSTSEFRDLAPAVYVYTVTTDRSCSAQEQFTIINPPEFTPDFSDVGNVTCAGEDNGFIRIVASGGTPPYSYAINNEAFLNDVSDGIIGEHTFDELAPGMYTVIAQDALGCSEIRDIEITEPTALMVGVDGEPTPETCFGDEDGSVTIIITGGTPPYRTSLTNNDADFVQDQFTFDDLAAGVVRIFIRDANDCPTDISVTIDPGVILEGILRDRLDCPVIDLDGNVTQAPRYFIDFVLGENSVTTDIVYTLTGVNGTPNPPSNFNMTGTFEVSPGEYEGTMLHADGCSEPIPRIEVEEYIPMTLPVAVMTGNPQDPNEYEINVTGGVQLPTDPFYTFLLGYVGLTSNEIPLNEVDYNIAVDGNVFRIRQTGFYAIRVIDANGCEVISLQELTYINIRIPNYFRPDDPNASSEERFWYPRQILPPGTAGDPFFFENMEVTIFDRYGRMLKEFKGNQQGWSGIYQGKELPSGDYWFTIVLNDVDRREFTGHFTLYR